MYIDPVSTDGARLGSIEELCVAIGGLRSRP